MNEELEKLKEYLGLEKIEDAEKAKRILDELEKYGNWGNKVSSYFMSILSGTEGSRTLIPENKINAYKALFSEINITDNGEEKENNNDN